MQFNISFASLVLLAVVSLSYCSINLMVDMTHADTIRNSNIKFYKIDLRQDLNQDVAIEASLTKYDQKTKLPIMILSTKALPNPDRTSQWICGRLGKEKCVIPRNYIKNTNSLSVGIFCEECEYTLKYSYENNHNIELITEKQNELRKLVSLPTLRLLEEPLPIAEGNPVNTETPTTLPPEPTTNPTTQPNGITPPQANEAQNVANTQSVPLVDQTPGIPPEYLRNPSIPKTIEEKLNALRGAGVAGLLFGIMFVLCVIIAYYIHVVIFVNTKFVTEPLKLGKIE